MKRLLAWLLLVAALALVAASTRYTADLSAFLPAAPSASQQLLVDQLRRGPVSRLLLLAIEDASPARRASASRALADALRGQPGIASVENGTRAPGSDGEAVLFERRYLLGDAVDAGRLRGDGLRKAIADTLRGLGSSLGMVTKDLLARDPTGELQRLLERVGDDAGTAGPAVEDGVWASADGRRAILLVHLADDGLELDAQAATLAAIDAAFARIRPDDRMRLHTSGTARFAIESRAAIERDVTRLSLIGAAAIVALLLSVYRSPRRLLLGLLPVATGALAGVAAVSLAFGQVHGLTLGFGIALIGEGLDYAIYLFVQGPGRTLWRTIRLGVLTSLAGFSSLLFSSFPGLAQIGLFALTGVATAAWVSWWLLPSLAGPAPARLPGWLAHGLAPRLPMLRRWRHVPAIAALVALAVIAAGAARAPLWASSLDALSPVTEAARELDASLRADLHAPDLRHIVAVRAPTTDGALALAARVAEHLAPLVEDGTLGGIASPARWLPDRATQLRRRDALPDEAGLRADLRDATASLPIRAERLDPFVADVQASRSREPLTLASLDGTALGLAASSLLVPGEDGVTAMLALRAPPAGARANEIDGAAVAGRLARVGDAGALRAGEAIHLLDLKRETDLLYAGYLREALTLAAGGGVLIVLLLSPFRGSRALRVLLPLVASVCCVIAMLVLAGQAMTILHLVGLLLSVAVGSNYALFFGDGDDDPAMLASLLLANLTTVIGFGVLGFSNTPVLAAIGTTVAPGAALCLAFAAMASRPAVRTTGA
ncbi:MAG: MMPL family transporter [Lautropia sp.]